MTLPQSAAIVTTPHGGGTGSEAWAAFEPIKADLANVFQTPGQVFFNGNLAYNGVSDATNSFIFMPGSTLSGIANKSNFGVCSPFSFHIGADTVDTTTIGTSNLVGLSYTHAVSVGHTGGRFASQMQLAIVGSPSIAAGGAGYAASNTTCSAKVNLGGTSGAYANYRGSIFGSNPLVFTSNTATNLIDVIGEEIDVAIGAGTNSANKHGLQIVLTGIDSARGDYDDSAINFGVGDSATIKWKYGISFGNYAHAFAFGADSTLITVQQRQVGPASLSIALYGVDFRNCTFQTGGAAFISTGFQVDPTGQVVTQVATVATLPTGIKGGRAFVTDATQTMTAGIGAIVAGTGANNVPVFYDGTNWRIG